MPRARNTPNVLPLDAVQDPAEQGTLFNDMELSAPSERKLQSTSRFYSRLAAESDGDDDFIISYMPRGMVQAMLPYKRISTKEQMIVRRRGDLQVTLKAAFPEMIGLPSGAYPRLLLAYITQQAVRTRSPHIVIGDKRSDLTSCIGRPISGGANGTLRLLLEQFFALRYTMFYFDWQSNAMNQYAAADKLYFPINEVCSWIDACKRESTVPGGTKLVLPKVFPEVNGAIEFTLSQDFFNEITTGPVPINLEHLVRLSESPVAMDLYCFLTYRVFYLRGSSTMSWRFLRDMFGPGYKRLSGFKAPFKQALSLVCSVYKGLNVTIDDKVGMIVRKSPTDVPRIIVPGSDLPESRRITR